jgi:hypothetical protein
MAELLVRVVDRVGANVYQDAKLTKRGDVIAVCPDGWPWGTTELANPEWRIVRVPGVAPEALAYLTAEEIESAETKGSRVLQRRAFKFDVDATAIGKAGLREFFDKHEQVDIEAKPGKTLEEIAITEVVQSKREDIIGMAEVPVENPLARGLVRRAAVVAAVNTARTITKYPVAELSPRLKDTLAKLPGVVFVDAKLRASLVADADPELVEAVSTRKPALRDPSIIGDEGGVIGLPEKGGT